jgi:hypothetical protein
LIVFNDGQTEFPGSTGNAAEKWSDQIERTDIPLYPHISDMFGSTNSFFVLLRPDNYIGLISKDFSPETVRSYFNNVGI